MYHPIHDDPEHKLQMQDYQHVRRTLGRTPTDADMREYYQQRDIRLQQEKSAREQRDQAEREEKQRRELERQNALDERSRTSGVRPNDFRIVTTADELKVLSRSGQAYCEGTTIAGTKQNLANIDFDLESFNFQRSTFRHVVFGKTCNISNANFRNCTFESVVFARDANLEGVDFREAEFREVRFTDGCKLAGASFPFAKFKKGVTIQFDRNDISNAAFSAPRSDAWYKLSNAYAGIFQYINLTLSGIYFGFILLKLYLFKAFSVIEPPALNIAHRTGIKLDEYTKVSVFDFVFGSQLTSLAIALVVLLYQTIRIYLTMRIGPLIEAERRTGYTPARYSFDPYVGPHTVGRVLGFIAISLFIYELWGLWTQQPLLVPKRWAPGSS
jgi:uncharacterized protein YjbI with pentapeptide repeats